MATVPIMKISSARWRSMRGLDGQLSMLPMERNICALCRQDVGWRLKFEI